MERINPHFQILPNGDFIVADVFFEMITDDDRYRFNMEKTSREIRYCSVSEPKEGWNVENKMFFIKNALRTIYLKREVPSPYSNA